MAKIRVGEDVWYRAGAHEAGPYPGNNPLAALVIAVNGDRVNLMVFSQTGTMHPVLNVPYLDKGSLAGGKYAQPIGGNHVEPDAAQPLPEEAKLGDLVEAEVSNKKPTMKERIFGGAKESDATS